MPRMNVLIAWIIPFVLASAVTAIVFVNDEDVQGASFTEKWWDDQVVLPIDYVISDNVVRSSEGHEVLTEVSFTSALRWAVGQTGKVTFVPNGMYNVTDSLHPASDTVLIGEGDGPKGTVFNFTSSLKGDARIEVGNMNNVSMKDFRIVGNGNLEVWSDIDICGKVVIENVTVFGTSAVQPGAFMTWTSNGGILDGLAFIRCKALGTGCIGFNLQGDGDKESVRMVGGWVKNVYFEECVASYCGVDQRYNDWVCGFDLAEGTNIENLMLLNCESSNNWRDGFHFERWPLVLRGTFENCTAFNNMKGGSGTNYVWSERTQQVLMINVTGIDR